MKTIPHLPRLKSRWLPAALLGIAVLAGAQPRATAGFYSFRARSTNTGGIVDTTQTANGGFNTKTSHSVGVEITLTAMQPPAAGYDVDWFFIAKGIVSKKEWISGGGTEHTDGRSYSKKVFSKPLVDEKDRTVTRSVSSVSSDSITIRTTTTDSIGGSKLEGWVVRLRSEGKVLQYEGSQAGLVSFAKQNEKLFEEALSKLKSNGAANRVKQSDGILAQRNPAVDFVQAAGIEARQPREQSLPICLKLTGKVEDVTYTSGFSSGKQHGLADNSAAEQWAIAEEKLKRTGVAKDT